ncbi:UDP-N-acetylmuramate--L-alanine ligase [Psychroflexus sp. YR1-1]|uniref:UDP-N-acetylmuramate--L-alanine ligase n=1 Tax=Psychroflexus aurantiacus TaxID=2709310 RepID=A0A6B3R0M9_9FLAO|nr:UDP-N-acetylmuramate--L-alanine ligase [Psychroflexus aurantiacus]NEV93752.1 UDP-N-acetylmuramate--L-alanine ligase [Psychroflexus aurantiacus]
MKEISQYTHVFLIGIGGIGMSALARYFNQKGLGVSGYDRTESELTKSLLSEGIDVVYSESVNEQIQNLSRETTLVIYTPAISKNSAYFDYFSTQNFEMHKRSVVLGHITKHLPTLAVAGTHGKTTTSAILVHILKASGVKLTAFCGGILQNYKTNYIGDGEEVVVVEADEFDRSFLRLHPSAAVINSMDADHLDIYETSQKLIDTFREFSQLVPKGHLYAKSGLDLDARSIALDEEAEVQVNRISIENGSYRFDFKQGEVHLKGLQFALPGHHNLLNAAAALALAIDFKPELASSFGKALASFEGVQRRFNYIYKSNDLLVIDDYAHHPKEIDAVYQAISEMHPEQKTVVIFQPHLFSRTRDFAEDFAISLAQFDEVNLLDIYPAREVAIEGVTSEFLLNLIQHSSKQLITKNDIHNRIKIAKDEVIVLLGAGDIGIEATKISNYLHERV